GFLNCYIYNKTLRNWLKSNSGIKNKKEENMKIVNQGKTSVTPQDECPILYCGKFCLLRYKGE
ncbi:MAG: hypothetical protein ABIN23_07680, partial [candidate division WOR-3 bacterium]